MNNTTKALDEALDFLNEAYIGKTETLRKAEKQLGIIRSKLTQTNIDNSSPEVLKFNRLMEKQFGMDIFALKILTTGELDAYTVTVGLRFDRIDTDMSKFVTGSLDKGYKFIKGNNICVIVNISYGFLGNRHYSDADCMAVILHEVGHNFGECIFDSLVLYNSNIMAEFRDRVIESCFFKALANYTMKHNYNSANDMRVEKKRQSKRSSRVLAFLKGTATKLKERSDMADYIRFRLTYGSAGLVDNYYKNSPEFTEDKRKANITSEVRKSEVIADKFPAIYGYGSSIVNAIYKMNDIAHNKEFEIANKKGNFKQRENNFNISLLNMRQLDLDEHPHTIQRVHVALNTLEAEYKKENIDPKVKAELKKQIDRIRKQLDESMDASTKLRNIEKAQANFYRYVNLSAPDAMTKEIEDEIDKVLDDKLEEIEKKS